jgi:hypothetical protein
MSDKMVQSVSQMGQLPESDVKRIIKLHNLRMDAFDQRRRDELERTRARLQQKMQERMKVCACAFLFVIDNIKGQKGCRLIQKLCEKLVTHALRKIYT